MRKKRAPASKSAVLYLRLPLDTMSKLQRQAQAEDRRLTDVARRFVEVGLDNSPISKGPS